jgi:HTH-type transcriptional regulator/antitoxin HipB
MADTGFDAIPTAGVLGAAVRRLRERAGLRQRDLALAAGVGERFLVELEAGKPTVRLDKVLAVLEALGARLGLAPAVLAEAEDLRNAGDAATTTAATAGGPPTDPGI